MQAHLYFICPTDYLEPIINRSFKQRNYFYTSLGNSFVFDQMTMAYLRDFILKHSIEEISLVLSENNSIIDDALTKQGFSKMRNLDSLYNNIKGHKGLSEMFWPNNNCSYTILSYYLNKKIQELRVCLDDLDLSQIEINGKIYNQKANVFDNIYSELICRDYFSLN